MKAHLVLAASEVRVNFALRLCTKLAGGPENLLPDQPTSIPHTPLPATAHPSSISSSPPSA